MCTLSRALLPDGVEIFFNRDEQRSRPKALPPTTDANGILAPMDPQGGGPWIFAKPNGICGALLNAYHLKPLPVPSDGFRSRGLLMRDLAEVITADNVMQVLGEMLTRHPYPPFFFARITRQNIRAWHWNGEKLADKPLAFPMLTTSAFKPEIIVPLRIRRYCGCTAIPENPEVPELERFHNWHEPEMPEVSTLMSRADARTVSFTRVSIREGESPRMVYTDNSPQQTG
ncbi:MAG: NRDE family protein [Verrucomicrobia bacterium]|nr:NRDE family protein [Verrucomicrobiota bacterium]MCH8510592.1 NRDE family protein [Kiritimatiellia bacterium]